MASRKPKKRKTKKSSKLTQIRNLLRHIDKNDMTVCEKQINAVLMGKKFWN